MRGRDSLSCLVIGQLLGLYDWLRVRAGKFRFQNTVSGNFSQRFKKSGRKIDFSCEGFFACWIVDAVFI